MAAHSSVQSVNASIRNNLLCFKYFFILQGYGKKSFKTDLEIHKVTLAETVFIIYV